MPKLVVLFEGGVWEMYDREEAFRFIVEHKRKHGGDTPTLRQIADALGVKSTSTAWRMVRELVEDGRLVEEQTLGRKLLRVPGDRWEVEEEGDGPEFCM